MFSGGRVKHFQGSLLGMLPQQELRLPIRKAKLCFVPRLTCELARSLLVELCTVFSQSSQSNFFLSCLALAVPIDSPRLVPGFPAHSSLQAICMGQGHFSLMTVLFV